MLTQRVKSELKAASEKSNVCRVAGDDYLLSLKLFIRQDTLY